MYKDVFTETYLQIINQGVGFKAGKAYSKGKETIKNLADTVKNAIKQAIKNTKDEIKDFASVAKDDSAEGHLAAGIQYLQEKDYKRAIERFVEARNKGNDKATYFLGLCSMNGYGVEQDVDKGFALIQKASKAGVKEAKETQLLQLRKRKNEKEQKERKEREEAEEAQRKRLDELRYGKQIALKAPERDPNEERLEELEKEKEEQEAKKATEKKEQETKKKKFKVKRKKK